MTSFLRAAAAGLTLWASASMIVAEEGFKPQLQKATVNGQVLYDVAAKEAIQPVLIDSAAPTKFECTFVNTGDRPGEDPFVVFLHVLHGESVIGGDYSPATPTTAWTKGKMIVDSKTIDLARFKGKKVEVYLGLFKGEDRISLVNAGMDYQQRLPLGVLFINRLPSAEESRSPKP